METLYIMIVGSKETVEHSVPHTPFVDGIDWVGVSLSNPCPLKMSVEFNRVVNPREHCAES